MLNTLWETVQRNESNAHFLSLTERTIKAAECIRDLHEKVGFKDSDLEQAGKMLSAAKRGLSVIDNLPKGTDTQEHSERLMANLDKIKNFVSELVKRQVDVENEEIEAFNFDDYFDKPYGEDCSCDEQDPLTMSLSTDDEPQMGEEPGTDLAMDDDITMINMAPKEENEEAGVVYQDPEGRYMVIKNSGGMYVAVGRGGYKHELEKAEYSQIEDAIGSTDDALEYSMVGMEDEECAMKRSEEDEEEKMVNRPAMGDFDLDPETLAADHVKRKAAAIADPDKLGYSTSTDPDNFIYDMNGPEDENQDYTGAMSDPELDHNYNDEFDPDDIMMRGQRDFDHSQDDSMTGALTDEEGGEWMDVADPESMDDDYHENEEETIRRMKMDKLRRKLTKRAGEENEEMHAGKSDMARKRYSVEDEECTAKRRSSRMKHLSKKGRVREYDNDSVRSTTKVGVSKDMHALITTLFGEFLPQYRHMFTQMSEDEFINKINHRLIDKVTEKLMQERNLTMDAFDGDNEVDQMVDDTFIAYFKQNGKMNESFTDFLMRNI